MSNIKIHVPKIEKISGPKPSITRIGYVPLCTVMHSDAQGEGSLPQNFGGKPKRAATPPSLAHVVGERETSRHDDGANRLPQKIGGKNRKAAIPPFHVE